VAVKDYYQLLGVVAAASADDVKRAFRQQIARYHPDKVQHLGQEFQELAADRAAELTEAYRILSNEGLRQEYDRTREIEAPGETRMAGRSPAPGKAETEPDAAPESSPPAADAASGPRAQFTRERASRDVFVKKASLTRFRQAMGAALGSSVDEVEVRGFDVACVPKSKLFARTKGPRLLAKWVPRVDGAAVTATWTQAAAATWQARSQDDICVFLIGSEIAPPGELADAIAEQRRRPPRGPKVTLIPVDMRDWDARMPVDAPAVAKQVMERLKSGS
jgi:curved DNA-binding protein CbpA